jgi:DNA repair exonuclease SbcCD ATPase subunit
MKQFILKNMPALTGVAALLLIGGLTMSFQDTKKKSKPTEEITLQDTLPGKRYDGSMTMKEFDNLMKDMDKKMIEVADEIKKIDFAAIEKQLEASLKEVDIEKIMKDVNNSIKAIDVEKIVADATKSLKEINWEEKNEEIKKALNEAKDEIEKAKIEIKEINKDEIKKELEEARKEIEKAKQEIKKIDMSKIMAEAKQGVEEAKKELKLTKEMFNEMEKDGLINPKDGFTIEYKDKDLYINGQKQKPQVTDKYRKYMKDDHFKIKIEKE